MSTPDPCFHRLENSIDETEIPKVFSDPYLSVPSKICLRLCEKIYSFIAEQTWDHNFGLVTGQHGLAIGKMFGILLVEDAQGQFGYLVGFSGKIGDSHNYFGFVPPVSSGLLAGGFIETGMVELERLNSELNKLEKVTGTAEMVEKLKASRTRHSNSLQDRIYASYRLINTLGETLDLKEIFEKYRQSKPPGGAGDCAAPKLLQYAFLNGFKPIEIVEFWWGRSDRNSQWKHKEFYPPCQHKCEPILAHMLKGLSEN